MPDELDVSRLEKISADMITAITSPPFVAAMHALKSTPMEKRLEVATRLLTPSALSKAGVELPKGMRITSQSSEPGSSEVIEVDEKGASLNNVLNDVHLPGGVFGGWACACGGAATVCGGAGGGGGLSSLAHDPHSDP